MESPHILIVEDEVVTAMALERSVRKMGYDVEGPVDTGEAAVSAARDKHLDLVLMDIRLRGEMDGTKAASIIRDELDVPVVYLTAYSDQETLQRAKVATPYGYLVKPYNEKELRATIEIALHNAALERDRRAAEEAVRTRERLLQDVVDNSRSVVYLKDLEGRYTLVNRAYEMVFGIRRDAARGHDDDEILGGRLKDALWSEDVRALASGNVTQVEQEIVHAGIPHVYIGVRFPLRKPSGDVYGVCGVLTDITDRKRAEDALRRLNVELEARVASRTSDLLEVNRRLADYAHRVSHDLRRPARSIGVLAERLEEEAGHALRPEDRQVLDGIRRESRRLIDLINGIMSIAEVGASAIERSRVDLSAAARAVVSRLQVESPREGVEVEIEDGLFAQGNPLLLEVVLENLLGNAWKYTRDVPQARIRFGARVTDGRRVFFVEDNGIGFDPANAERIFEPFERLADAEAYPGHGLGLSSVRQILEAHGGRVWARGERGKGATFFFSV